MQKSYLQHNVISTLLNRGIQKYATKHKNHNDNWL